ncbi:hypothetical protein I5Q83_09775 [Enterocloster clostridioformis]|nr:hypothetical protein I5Q83_09775 [Enterocloster clostridioformis]
MLINACRKISAGRFFRTNPALANLSLAGNCEKQY